MIKEIRNAKGEIARTIWDGTQWKDKSIEEETRAFLEAYKERYPEKKQPEYVDTYGEVFFLRYAHKLTKNSTKIDIYKVLEDIEGKDGVSFDILGGSGNIEIKTIKPFLTQNNNPVASPDSGGSIPFEIFQSWPRKDNNLTLEDLYAGWLLSAYNNATYNDIKKKHGRREIAETPGLYAFVLMGSTIKPYACIVFENIKALLERLWEICPDAENWGIPDPDTLTPATDQNYWNKYNAWSNYGRISGGMIQNVWNVPFRSIHKLATVTMINNIDLAEELRKATYQCTLDVVEKRYNNLQWVADQDGRGTHFDPEAWTREETEKIRRLEANGAKVSKRNFISIDGDKLEELKKGIELTHKGEAFGRIWLEEINNDEK